MTEPQQPEEEEPNYATCGITLFVVWLMLFLSSHAFAYAGEMRISLYGDPGNAYGIAMFLWKLSWLFIAFMIILFGLYIRDVIRKRRSGTVHDGSK